MTEARATTIARAFLRPDPVGDEVVVSVPLIEEKSISLKGIVRYVNKDGSSE
jgi:hypothetical protein